MAKQVRSNIVIDWQDSENTNFNGDGIRIDEVSFTTVVSTGSSHTLTLDPSASGVDIFPPQFAGAQNLEYRIVPKFNPLSTFNYITAHIDGSLDDQTIGDFGSFRVTTAITLDNPDGTYPVDVEIWWYEK